MSKPTFTIGAYAVIFDEKNRILFCHRTDYDLWNLPGGSLDHGETPWNGVIREVKEETGLNVEIVRLAGIYSKPDINEIIFQYVCTAIGGKLTLNDEADKIEYFAYEDIPLKTIKIHIARIKDVLENPNELVTKIQKHITT
jgi:8-oxo-dGTP diphosphatase